MKILRWLALTVLLFLLACQPQASATVTLVDGNKILAFKTNERLPAAIFEQAGMNLAADDAVIFNGLPVAQDQPLDFTSSNTLQVRRAVKLTIISAAGTQTILTAAATVGQALSQAGIVLYGVDQFDPPADTPIGGPLTVKYTPSRELTVSLAGGQMNIRSAAPTVGEALAEGGIPLTGLDISQPTESEALPANGQVIVKRISEALVLSEKSIPFNSAFVSSDSVELDHQDILQPGQPGLSVSRVRIKYMDGQELSRQTESETVVRPPQDRVIGFGTKVVVHAGTVDGVQIQYWRAVQMYATSYSPCRSGPSACITSTSSGKTVQKGIVAVKYSWFLAMEGQALYIPGYGFATIADVCGGCVGKPWVDLGYSDSDYQGWGQWVTVYFLAPVPPNILNPLN